MDNDNVTPKEYRIGDNVKIRTWESMVKEYGKTKSSIGEYIIRLPGKQLFTNPDFIETMRYLCDSIQIIEDISREIDGRDEYLLEGICWIFTKNMFQLEGII